MYHNPVLLIESVDGLNINPSGVYVDATFGGGGHSREILSRLSEKGRLFSFDQDEDAQQNEINDKRFKLVRGNFRFMQNYLNYYGLTKIDGILADLGVSSHQFDVAERGFSYRLGGNLDMRMSPAQNLTAADILNTYEDRQLYYIFNNYCDLKNVGKLVKLILNYRESNSFLKIEDFIQAISPAMPKLKDFKYLAQVFQVLRIEVNDEIGALNDFLSACPGLLNPGGRLSIISYHSLEDRPVKNLIKTGNVEGKVETDAFGRSEKIFKAINRHVIIASEEEIANNTRAKSAKLRIAEKI